MATAHVVVDVGYGDAGKGAYVDWVVDRHRSTLVVRVHGGAQAGHNVVAPDGRHHTFSQFGAANLQPGVRTLHGPGMIVAPLAWQAEAKHLQQLGVRNPLGLLTVDRRCRVTTPLHQATNRIRERLRGAGRHGSCGIGVGETVRDGLQAGEEALVAGDLANVAATRAKLAGLRARLLADVGDQLVAARTQSPQDVWVLADAPLADIAQLLHAAAAPVRMVGPDEVATVVAQAGDLVIEGAQGVLIDEWAGFHPFTTWSTCTTASANQFLREVGWLGLVLRHGVVRSHMVRHGAGPLVGEDPALTQTLPEGHNRPHDWQGTVRKGRLDLVALRYALDVCSDIDDLAVTHLDQLPLLPDHPWVTGWQCADADRDWVAQAQGDVVTRLALPTPPDLDRQVRLTALAQRAVAVTGGPALADAQAWLTELGQRLGLPVVAGADGMTRLGWRDLT